jgi:CubicO group peptidase (beta-lactamase class C family)
LESNQFEIKNNDSQPLHSESFENIAIPDLEINRIRSYFESFVGKRKFNGHIIVAKSGKIVFDTTSGFANIRKRIKLNKNSVIQLASITKPITATVILQLLEEGKLSLKDTITKYLSNLPDYYNKITIKQLLSHRSGLSPYPYYCHEMIDNKSNLIYNDTVLCVIDFHNPKPYYSPGKRYNYCNTNYMLLASIIEHIEKKRYVDVIDKRIVQKCDMKDSFVIDAKKNNQPSNLTLGHTNSNKTFELDYLDGVIGDKGFFSNAKDMLQFDRMLSRGRIISDSTINLAFTAQNKFRRNKSYGLGWRIKMHKKLGKIIYHTGWWHGNRNIYIKIPKNNYTIIILSNSIQGSAYNLSYILDEFDFPKI